MRGKELNRREQRRALKLLWLAKCALDDEYNANGHKETMQHPTLKDHFRTQMKIENFLAKLKAEQQ